MSTILAYASKQKGISFVVDASLVVNNEEGLQTKNTNLNFAFWFHLIGESTGAGVRFNRRESTPQTAFEFWYE